MKPALQELADRAFPVLEQCAARGDRCPVTSGPDAHPFILPSHIVALARQGRISIEVSSKNWRVVTILTGPHKGKRTAPNPYKHSRVYKTINANGCTVNGITHGARPEGYRQPSAPPRLRFQDLPEVD